MTGLVGNEVLYVSGLDGNSRPSATQFPTTTGAIAALAADTVLPPVINTAISTVGAGTLTAAGIVGGLITRTGSVAAFTDTTDTAVNIVAALTAYVAAESFYLRIKNQTNFAETLAAGAGVTLSGTSVIIPPNSVGTYLVTIDSTTAVTMLHVATAPLSNGTPRVITTLSTVGAGTITAAGIAGGFTSRTGSQSATPFTDTTDTASNIIAADLNSHVGDVWEWTYANTTNAAATIAGGTGVTPSGITVIPAGYAVKYLVTYTAAATITMVAVAVSQSATSEQSLILAGSTSGTTTLVATAAAGSTTQTLPAVTGVVASTSGTNLFVADVYRCTTAQTANANVTPATITGLSGAVAVGTYRFRAYLPSTVASGTGGIAYNFLLTTAVLGVMECTGHGYTASAVAVQHTTTATSGTALFTQAAVVISTLLEGTFTVTTAGTFALQMCQNTSNASNSVALVGGYMELTRIV